MGAITYDKLRHQWIADGTPPLIGGAKFSWSQIKYFCIHYCGAGRYAGKNEQQVLNAIQKDYVNNRGYSFGYSAAIGLSGTSYEGRGEVYRAASNGDSTNKDDDLEGNPGILDNLEVFSCLLIIGSDDKLTNKLIDKVNEMYSQMPPGVVVCGHQDLDATECPGEEAFDYCHDGTFHRGANPVPPLPFPENIVIDKFTILDPPDRFYDSRTFDDRQPIGPGVTKFGIKAYNGQSIPAAVECTVTAMPLSPAEGGGFLGVGSDRDSFINWVGSDVGKAIPGTVWFPVDDQGEISVFTTGTIHIAISCRAYG